MNVILFDDQLRNNLLPLCFTRPVSETRIGILTITEKWKQRFQTEVSYLTEEYLQEKYPLVLNEHNVFINSSVCPDDDLAEAISILSEGDAMLSGKIFIAARLNESAAKEFNFVNPDQYRRVGIKKTFL